MNRLAKYLARVGEWAAGLSEQTRIQVVVSGVVLLMGCGLFKLVRSINKLNVEPVKATPEQLIKPMEKLFKQTNVEAQDYFYRERVTTAQLDSLGRLIDKSKKP